jgi:hypothetical protein
MGSEPLLRSLELDFEELAMANHLEGAVDTPAELPPGAEGVAETRKDWVAPELRKFEIAEVTGANVTVNPPDGTLAS